MDKTVKINIKIRKNFKKSAKNKKKIKFKEGI